MLCAVAYLTSILGWTVMNYYAPNWVRYGSLKFSNPAKIEDFPAEGKNLEFERWVYNVYSVVEYRSPQGATRDRIHRAHG